jgi:hypothetical protein
MCGGRWHAGQPTRGTCERCGRPAAAAVQCASVIVPVLTIYDSHNVQRNNNSRQKFAESTQITMHIVLHILITIYSWSKRLLVCSLKQRACVRVCVLSR